MLSASGARLHGELAALVTLICRGFVQTSALSCFIGRERSAVVEFLNASDVVCAVKKDLIAPGKILVGACNTETCDSNCSVFVDIVGAAGVATVNPSSGFSRGGQRFTVNGQFLQSSTSCVFDGIASAAVEFGSPLSWVVCLLPGGFHNQSVSVWVLP